MILFNHHMYKCFQFINFVILPYIITNSREEWQEKVYDREEWNRLLRTARNHRILYIPMDLFVAVNIYIYIYIYITATNKFKNSGAFEFFFSWLSSPSGSEPPHCWGFEITHSVTHTHSIWFLWTSDQLVTDTSNWQHTQQSQERDTHAPDRIRTPNPSNRHAADPRLRPRGHRGRQFINSDWIRIIKSKYCKNKSFSACPCLSVLPIAPTIRTFNTD